MIRDRASNGWIVKKYFTEEERRAARAADSRRYRARHPERSRENSRKCIRNRDPEKRRISHNRASAAHRRMRRDILARAKDRPCFDCGIRYPKCVMDLDHISGKKEFNVGAGLGKPIHILIAEIDKCEAVCANCHRLREWRKSENKRCED